MSLVHPPLVINISESIDNELTKGYMFRFLVLKLQYLILVIVSRAEILYEQI